MIFALQFFTGAQNGGFVRRWLTLTGKSVRVPWSQAPERLFLKLVGMVNTVINFKLTNCNEPEFHYDLPAVVVPKLV